MLCKKSPVAKKAERGQPVSKRTPWKPLDLSFEVIKTGVPKAPLKTAKNKNQIKVMPLVFRVALCQNSLHVLKSSS